MTPLETLRHRGKAGVARALSDIEARPGAPDVTDLLDAAFAAPLGHALGITGPPGVGKSSLTDALLRGWRAAGKSVAILAIDPSSKRSGGALLGDRTRITLDPEDQGAFLRSMAARDRLGGVAEITFPALVLMRALFDRVIVETVGVGQSETAIAGLCDTVMLCAQPASGDALQFLKAGVMEVPDLVVVTKSDLGPLAARTVADLKGALSVTGGRDGTAPAVLACSARDEAGVGAVLAAVDAQAARFSSGSGAGSARAAQLAAWHRDQIAHRFGTATVAALGPELTTPASEKPFHAMAAQISALDAALHHVLAKMLGRPNRAGYPHGNPFP
ncbi:MAG: ArgK/MeaB family GTPase [Pikeienuella sp.]